MCTDVRNQVPTVACHCRVVIVPVPPLNLGTCHCLQVVLTPAAGVCFQPHPEHDAMEFASVAHLAQRVGTQGYYGGIRLLMVGVGSASGSGHHGVCREHVQVAATCNHLVACQQPFNRDTVSPGTAKRIPQHRAQAVAGSCCGCFPRYSCCVPQIRMLRSPDTYAM